MTNEEKACPACNDWITVAEVSDSYGVSEQIVRNAMRYGRKNRAGKVVKLASWKTIKGTVTTRAELDLFHKRLNA